MSKKLYVEAEPLDLKHPEEAKRFVFEHGKSICFTAVIGCTYGAIHVIPKEGGTADFKMSCAPANSLTADVLHIACPDADSFEDTFERARYSLLRKMREVEARRKKTVPKA